MSCNDVGTYLKELRESCGFSQKDVFSRTKITNSRLSRIENGDKQSDIAPSDLRALAQLYDVSVVSLFLKAGYLMETDLLEYKRVFHGVDLLTQAERKNTQEQIDLFIAGRNKK